MILEGKGMGKKGFDDFYQEEIYRVEIIRDKKTGVAICEKWTKDDKVHRQDGPAMIDRDKTTGAVVREVWMRDDERHREDGPAVVLRKASTGKVYRSGWYENGVHIEQPKPPKPPGRTRRPAADAGPVS
jgi:hypothetical protein